MSNKFFGPRNAAILAMVGTVGYLFFPTPASPTTYVYPDETPKHPDLTLTSNPFETQASKNIGNRWSAGGGSDVHTPGAATKRGTALPQSPSQRVATDMHHRQLREHSRAPTEPQGHQHTPLPREPSVATTGRGTLFPSMSLANWFACSQVLTHSSLVRSTRRGTSPTTAPRRANRGLVRIVLLTCLSV